MDDTRPTADERSALNNVEPSLVRLLDRIVIAGIACTLLLAPLAMGGRYAFGRLILISFVCCTTACWCLSKTLSPRPTSWIRSGGEWIGLLAILLVVVQLLPLSPSWSERLSPQTLELLPLWSGTSVASDTTDAWPRWDTITLSTQATRGGLAMLITYLMVFGVVTQTIRSRRHAEGLLRLVAVAGIAMATLGLLQYFAANGRFLWFYEHPSRDTWTAVKGTFANENHFAHFLALTVGAVVWWLLESHGQPASKDDGTFRNDPSTSITKMQVFLGGGLGVILLAGLLTYSRGGIAMILLALTTSVALFAVHGRIGRRATIAMGAVACVLAGAIWIHGQDVIVREMETIQAASVESLDEGRSRRKIWQAVSRAIPDFAVIGAGVGSHRDIYPTYFSEQTSVDYSHAENGYLQVLLETGGPGLGLLLCGIGLCGYWLVRTIVDRRATGASILGVPPAAAWIVSVVHALADFNWFIPANMTLTIVLVAIAARLTQFERLTNGAECVVMSRKAWALCTAVVVLCSSLAVRHYWGPARGAEHWDEYLTWSLASNRFASKSVGPGRQRRVGPVDRSSPDTLAWMTNQLEQVLKYDPLDGRAHIRLAAMSLRQFEQRQLRSDNAMTLAQIRDAARAAEFPSRQELNQWVTRAVGGNKVLLDRALFHAKRGLYLCPLQGRGYLYLSEVAFLDESLGSTAHDLLQQAHRVRPFDPSVQFALGREKLMQGDIAEAMSLWKEAFRRGTEVRKRIIAAVAARATPHELIQVFQPELNGLKDMFNHYRKLDQREQLAEIGHPYVSELEKQASLLTGESAARLWHDAQFAHWVLGDAQKAATAAVRCVESQGNVYQYHYACALRLRDANRLEEAIAEFRWCQARQPEDDVLRQVIAALQRDVRQRQASRSLTDAAHRR